MYATERRVISIEYKQNPVHAVLKSVTSIVFIRKGCLEIMDDIERPHTYISPSNLCCAWIFIHLHTHCGIFVSNVIWLRELSLRITWQSYLLKPIFLFTNQIPVKSGYDCIQLGFKSERKAWVNMPDMVGLHVTFEQNLFPQNTCFIGHLTFTFSQQLGLFNKRMKL